MNHVDPSRSSSSSPPKLSLLGRSALAYAERFGWAVHPLRPGEKRPLTAHGFKDASTDAEQIRAWWTATPEANIGIATGAVSGISVLDVDVKDNAGGDLSLRALLERYDADLSEHSCQRTPSSGSHYVFAYDARLRQGVACYGKGLDGRNDGGYIAAAPSLVGGARYGWIVKPDSVLVAPTWLLEAADQLKRPAEPGERKNPPGWADELMMTGAPKGERDYQAHRLIQHARETGRSEADCWARLTTFGANCTPPFDTKTDRNIAAKIRRAYARGPVFDNVPVPAKLGTRATTEGDGPRPRIRFRRGAALDSTPITYLVESMIPAGMFTALGGKDGMGKTLFGMEIIRCILTGQKLFNQFAVQQGPVYAMFLDDPEFLVRERLEQLGILNHPHLHIATENDVDMSDPRAMLDDLVQLIKAADPRPIFIFVDALYLFIPKGGQGDQGNSAGAMGPVVDAFNQVSRETGAALQLVAHDNKAGSDLAGSYAIRAGLKGILRFLLPPDVVRQIQKGDEDAADTPERVLQLNKLKTGKRGSWYVRLDGPGRWHFHGGAREYRRATVGTRIVAHLEDHGELTVEEIAKGLKGRPAEVRKACVRLQLANKITRRERPRSDGKPGRSSTVYGPVVEPAIENGTDRSEQGPEMQNGTDRFRGGTSNEEREIASIHQTYPPNGTLRPSEERKAIRPVGVEQPSKQLSVPAESEGGTELPAVDPDGMFERWQKRQRGGEATL
jgi:hypothetical protein